jgi:hypothetical protein
MPGVASPRTLSCRRGYSGFEGLPPASRASLCSVRDWALRRMEVLGYFLLCKTCQLTDPPVTSPISRYRFGGCVQEAPGRVSSDLQVLGALEVLGSARALVMGSLRRCLSVY